MCKAVCPGSFDPITNGHLDILTRASYIFDNVIIAVAVNYSKTPLFTIKERVKLVRETTSHLDNVEVTTFDNLLIDFTKAKGAKVIVKGLRAVSDFEYEFQMASLNRKLNNDIETMFIMTSNKYAYLSSSVVKEISSLGGCVDELVPEEVSFALNKKLKESS